jgi:hypothetical protein
MRTWILVLLAILYSVGSVHAAGGGRLGRIHAGMTRTDVAIELGRPAEVRIEQEATFWIYPSSNTEICMIKFVNQVVVQESMKCDSSATVKDLAQQASVYMPVMNSDVEYQGRVLRYCGKKPAAQPGCKISDQCINGGWEETCP